MPKIIIEGVRGDNLTSRAISWFGGGNMFSHTRAVLPSGDYIDSRSDWTCDGTIPPGVQLRPKDYDEYVVFCVRFEISVTKSRADAFYDFLRSQINKPYDHVAIWDFVTGSADDRNWREESAWFCDELDLFACEQAGFSKIFIPAYRANPNMAAAVLTAWGFVAKAMPTVY